VVGFVPSGYMLATAETASGRYLVMQLCDDHDGPVRAIDLDTGKDIDASRLARQSPAPHLPASDMPDHRDCIFAAAPHLAAPAPAPAASPPVSVASATTPFVQPVDAGGGSGIAARPPPARGPPA
jgi:hypothetical protein